MTTPLWVPLVVAALGFVSTVVGIVVTQIMANRRERASWQRDTDREQQRWQREDQARTFEHRHTAYVEFYEALRAMMLRVYDHGMGLSDEGNELPEGWQNDAAEAVRRLEGTVTLIEKCSGALEFEAVATEHRWVVHISGGNVGRGDLTPDREAVGHLGSPFGRAEQMPSRPEVCGDAAEGRQEPLRMPRRFEAFHRPFA